MVGVFVRVNIPEEQKERFRLALAKLLKELSENAKIEQFHDEEEEIRELSIELGRKVNKSLHERYKELYPELE